MFGECHIIDFVVGKYLCRYVDVAVTAVSIFLIYL